MRLAAGLTSASQRPPSAAKQFAARSSTRRSGRRRWASRRRPRWRRRARARRRCRRGAAPAPSRRSRSRCGPRRRRRRRTRRSARRVAGLALTTVGVPRNGAPAARLGELVENSPKLRCSERSRIRPRRPLSQPRSCCRCSAPPRSRPAASRDRPVRTRRTTSLRVPAGEVPITWAVVEVGGATRRARTFEAPLPKRPLAGLSSAGIWTVVEVGIGRPRLLTHAGGPWRRREGAGRVRSGRCQRRRNRER